MLASNVPPLPPMRPVWSNSSWKKCGRAPMAPFVTFSVGRSFDSRLSSATSHALCHSGMNRLSWGDTPLGISTRPPMPNYLQASCKWFTPHRTHLNHPRYLTCTSLTETVEWHCVCTTPRRAFMDLRRVASPMHFSVNYLWCWPPRTLS